MLHNVMQYGIVLVYLFVYCFTAEVLKVCKTPGSTACTKTKMLDNFKVWLKVSRKEKKFHEKT